jgi:hypothetical protein
MPGTEKIVTRDAKGRLAGVIERTLSLEDELALAFWPSVRSGLSRSEVLAGSTPRITLQLEPRYATIDERALTSRLCGLIIDHGFRDSKWEALSFQIVRKDTRDRPVK